MIFIYGTHVKKDNISRFFLHYFKILIFWVVSGVKGQKVPQNDKNFCHLMQYLRIHTLNDCDFWYTGVKWWYLQQFFSFFKTLIFLVRGIKGQKMTQNYQFQSDRLYTSGTVDHIIISPGVFLYVFKKTQNCKY